MGQVVKYVLLALFFTAILTGAVAYINSLYPSETVTNLGIAVQRVVVYASDFIENVRGLLNYVLGSHLPLTICLSLFFVAPFVRFAVKIVIAVFRWFSQ